jgi:hypothetical protein
VDIQKRFPTPLAGCPNLDTRIAQFKAARKPFDPSGPNDRERQMIDQLVAASRELESI